MEQQIQGCNQHSLILEPQKGPVWEKDASALTEKEWSRSQYFPQVAVATDELK